jgi:hypothetical protein
MEINLERRSNTKAIWIYRPIGKAQGRRCQDPKEMCRALDPIQILYSRLPEMATNARCISRDNKSCGKLGREKGNSLIEVYEWQKNLMKKNSSAMKNF